MRTPLILLLSCAPALGAPMFEDVSKDRLPALLTAHKTMDAEFFDLDDDGDLDLVLALEWVPNVVLINDGSGAFPQDDAITLPGGGGDSEDIAIADFNSDGRPDIAIACEDTATNELYLQNEDGSFALVPDAPIGAGASNAILAHDLNGDGHVDLIVGNKGQNTILINTGDATFVDETAQRLPEIEDTTQDLELGDLDNDGDLDLVVANEDANRILFNDGQGRFAEDPERTLPLPFHQEETREADLGDIDNDGDLDLVCANVNWREGALPFNRVLLNDGAGRFTDVSDQCLPPLQLTTLDVDLVDIDNDGDLDWISAEMGGGGPTVFLNDGAGDFDYAPEHPLPTAAHGHGVDIECADLNNDGRPDLYVAQFGQADMLFLSRVPAEG